MLELSSVSVSIIVGIVAFTIAFVIARFRRHPSHVTPIATNPAVPRVSLRPQESPPPSIPTNRDVALAILDIVKPRPPTWGRRHPQYDRAEWEHRGADGHREEDYEWAFYCAVSRNDNTDKVERDHLIALSEAHKSGGAYWPKSRKVEFTYDSENIFLVPASLNATKYFYDPHRWQPDDKRVWRKYAILWIRLKVKWQLSFDRKEINALREMLATPDH